MAASQQTVKKGAEAKAEKEVATSYVWVSNATVQGIYSDPHEPGDIREAEFFLSSTASDWSDNVRYGRLALQPDDTQDNFDALCKIAIQNAKSFRISKYTWNNPYFFERLFNLVEPLLEHNNILCLCTHQEGYALIVYHDDPLKIINFDKGNFKVTQKTVYCAILDCIAAAFGAPLSQTIYDVCHAMALQNSQKSINEEIDRLSSGTDMDPKIFLAIKTKISMLQRVELDFYQPFITEVATRFMGKKGTLGLIEKGIELCNLVLKQSELSCRGRERHVEFARKRNEVLSDCKIRAQVLLCNYHLEQAKHSKQDERKCYAHLEEAFRYVYTDAVHLEKIDKLKFYHQLCGLPEGVQFPASGLKGSYDEVIKCARQFRAALIPKPLVEREAESPVLVPQFVVKTAVPTTADNSKGKDDVKALTATAVAVTKK